MAITIPGAAPGLRENAFPAPLIVMPLAAPFTNITGIAIDCGTAFREVMTTVALYAPGVNPAPLACSVILALPLPAYCESASHEVSRLAGNTAAVHCWVLSLSETA